jgi:mannose-6-phosphate isomerase-like protein (cupin superfamily)
MLHHRPNYKKDKVNGSVEGYKFSETSTIDLTIETNVGGWEHIEVSKEDRVLYVLKGLGFAKIENKTLRLEEGKVLEIPAGREVEMNGQFKFLCIRAKSK